MKNEIQTILLAVLLNRTEEEEARLLELIKQELDWGWIAGQLLHHRLGGYFLKGINEEMGQYIFPEFMRTLELLVKCNEITNSETLEYMQKLFTHFKEREMKVAALKGLVYNTSIYDLGVRRSNDSDILVMERDLEKLDDIMKGEGFIQSLDNGKTEATRKEKFIQLLNHHDLVPYCKNNSSKFLPMIKVDVNFHFDSKANDITEEIIDYGLLEYQKGDYKIQGLRWETNLIHLCIHFHREASNSIWTSHKRDVMLYKIVDIANIIRQYSETELINWCSVIKRFKLEEKCYFTLHYLNIFYPYFKLNNVMKLIQPDDIKFLEEIEILGKDEIVKRKDSFFNHTFNLKFSIDFFERSFTKTF